MEDREVLDFSYRAGYYNSDDILDVPKGAMIVPSSNVIYNRKGRPISIKDLNKVSNYGGSRAFTLDADLTGCMGSDITTSKAIGNMYQANGKSILFVGNAVNNTVQLLSGLTSRQQIGGTRQVETLTVANAPTSAGTLTVNVTINSVTTPVSVALSNLVETTATLTAKKIATAMRALSAITTYYYVKHSGATVVMTNKNIQADDSSLAMVIVAGLGITTSLTSANTTAGAVDYLANLSSTPQIAKYNGSFWENPVQVGLAPVGTAPQLTLTTPATMDSYFSGILTGSTSARIAQKRGGAVSIASGASNVITGDANSFYMTIPAYADDGSPLVDRIWLLYFTYTGKGSQAAHLQFPIELPESALDGSEDLGWSSTFGNAKIKVISQHESSQASRIVEVEFYNNDLLFLEPYDDYYQAGTCKFMAPLGNVNCLIGTGTDGTGFDVSFPNFREAYSPDWRDWMSEVPVSIAHSSELGMFWILTANNTYQAIWTGATQESAPVVLRQITSKYGSIGEGASVAVNGVLYFLSKGKTPVRISANREIDVEFGRRVINAFSTFDSTTQVGYDEANNSIVWACGYATISYQIDTNLWSSTCSLTTPSSGAIYSLFSMNGKLYACSWDSGSSSYKTYEYNAGTSTLNWLAASSYQLGKYGINLKDIIEFRAIVEADAQPFTITFTSSKDYNSTSLGNLFTPSAITSTGVKIYIRTFVEKLDYEAISIRAAGTAGGQTVHEILATVDHHEIERGI